MNKKFFVIFAAALCMMMLLSGCGESLSMVTAEDGRSAAIEFKNAKKDEFVLGGSLDVAEGQKLVIEQDLKEGSLASVRFINTDALNEKGEDASVEDIEDAVEPDKYTVEDMLMGTGRDEYGIEPGNYDIRVDVKEKSTGTVKISVE